MNKKLDEFFFNKLLCLQIFKLQKKMNTIWSSLAVHFKTASNTLSPEDYLMITNKDPSHNHFYTNQPWGVVPFDKPNLVTKAKEIVRPKPTYESMSESFFEKPSTPVRYQTPPSQLPSAPVVFNKSYYLKNNVIRFLEDPDDTTIRSFTYHVVDLLKNEDNVKDVEILCNDSTEFAIVVAYLCAMEHSIYKFELTNTLKIFIAMYVYDSINVYMPNRMFGQWLTPVMFGATLSDANLQNVNLFLMYLVHLYLISNDFNYKFVASMNMYEMAKLIAVQVETYKDVIQSHMIDDPYSEEADGIAMKLNQTVAKITNTANYLNDNSLHNHDTNNLLSKWDDFWDTVKYLVMASSKLLAEFSNPSESTALELKSGLEKLQTLFKNRSEDLLKYLLSY